MIGSTASQLVLTLAIFVVVVFVLGFVADPIINFYMDPYDTFASGVGNLSGEGRGEGLFPGDEEWEERGWGEHFGKGLAGLGLLGFLKALMAMSWWNWWNLRGALPGQGGGVRVGGGTTGRDRVAGVSFLVIAIGAGTFLWVSTSFPYVPAYLSALMVLCLACMVIVLWAVDADVIPGRLQRCPRLVSPNSRARVGEGHGCASR